MKIEPHFTVKAGKKVFMVAFALGLLANSQSMYAEIKADADKIFNWAEVKFPDLLQSHQTTQNLGPWLFRNYETTDFFTGVNTQDNGVYYITGENLRTGVNPTFFGNVTDALKIASENACDTSKLPANHTVTQNGNFVTVKTNGCIAEPVDTPDYCPQTAAAGGLSIKSTMSITQTTNGKSDAVDIVSCSKNVASDSPTPTIKLDLCYNDSSTPPVSTQTTGQVVYEKVDDCFKTNASTVIDIANDDFWVRDDSGVFQKFTTLQSPVQSKKRK